MLHFCSYIASNSFDDALAMCVDSSGYALVVGITASTSFPMQNPIQGTFGGGT